jgi:hypothetical protein
MFYLEGRSAPLGVVVDAIAPFLYQDRLSPFRRSVSVELDGLSMPSVKSARPLSEQIDEVCEFVESAKLLILCEKAKFICSQNKGFLSE